jgi:peptidoglycan/xylan/chitin deacetylase (PgdA/CDA1 family)
LTRCARSGQVALTFDDGPDTPTVKILDVLKARQVKATFFIVGVQLEEPVNQATFRRAFQEGHQLASHSYNHPDFSTLSEGQVANQLTRTDELIRASIGRAPLYFRYPFGSSSSQADQIVARSGYKIASWNLDPRDWETRDVNSILSFYESQLNAANSATDSFIALNHDLVPATADALDRLITMFQGKGYKLVTVAECVNDGESPYRS